MKVAVGASSFAAASSKAINMLLDKGIEVVKNPYGRKLTEEETIQHLQGADGLLAGLETLNENVFSKCRDLKAVARIGIGVDNVDFEAAKAHGVKISNTPDGPSNAVAEMTLAALLSIGRRIIPANNDLHNKIWKKYMGFSVTGLNVLVLGYGHIGKKTAGLLKSMGANVMVYDKYNEGVSDIPFEEGIKKADAITIHVSGNEEIFSEEILSKVKDGAVLLNSSRGAIINEDALYNALKSGKVSWYWGDVFWEEPYSGKITECENALLTPHISTYTAACREEMETQAVKNLLRDLGC